MAELWLVRHGQTDWNLEGRYQGQADRPLNAAGLEQAERAAESLVGRTYAAIYSSDLQRARVTAEIIGRRLGIEVIVDRRLREVNQGAWEGLLVAEIQGRYLQEWGERQGDRVRFRPPGGESAQDVADRLWPAVDEIAARHPDEQVILVSHGLSLATILCKVKTLPLTKAFDLIPENARAHCVEWRLPTLQTTFGKE